jgi:hypothetical protein
VHPLEFVLIYLIVAAPADTPVIKPPELTVAMPSLMLFHVPPIGLPVNWRVALPHIEPAPVICGLGNAFTVSRTVSVFVQEFAVNVNT